MPTLSRPTRREVLATGAAAIVTSLLARQRATAAEASSGDVPTGPGSLLGAPNLPAGFANTFASRYVDANGVRLHAVCPSGGFLGVRVKGEAAVDESGGEERLRGVEIHILCTIVQCGCVGERCEGVIGSVGRRLTMGWSSHSISKRLGFFDMAAGGFSYARTSITR